jgi:hypothetical protein
VTHAKIEGKATFNFASLPEGQVFISLESFPRGTGDCGPVIELELSGDVPESFRTLVP